METFNKFIKIVAFIVVFLSGYYLISYAAAEHNEKENSAELAKRHSSLVSVQNEKEEKLQEEADVEVVEKNEYNIIPLSFNYNKLILEKEFVENNTQYLFKEIPNEINIDDTSGHKIIYLEPIQEIVDEVEIEREPLEISLTMKSFYEENRDTVGWLTLAGTKIDNVVVQGKDNDYYLHHNFKKQESQPGTLFVDYRCNISDYDDLQSKNIIIYGHKQKSGTMFGTLEYYKNNLDFYKEHPTFTFSNLYETYTYKIISMFVIETDENSSDDEELFDYQNYINLNTSQNYTFTKFISNIKRRSQLNIPDKMKKDDQFMTLSTCSYEFSGARFVVIGRRLREDEDPSDIDLSKVEINNYAVKPNGWHIF